MPIFMTEARGPGRIAFSRDGVGHVFPMHLRAGEGIDVREHQFLAASSGVDYTFTRVRGLSNILFGGTGFFIDTFTCPRGEGVLWLHGYGNVFEAAGGGRADRHRAGRLGLQGPGRADGDQPAEISAPASSAA